MTTTATITLKEAVDALNAMIVKRQILDAIDLFYDDNVVMAEGADETYSGKAVNVERERRFVENLTSWNATLHASAVDERTGTAFNEWTLRFDHKEWGSVTLHQVAFQRWRDGKIVEERFLKF